MAKGDEERSAAMRALAEAALQKRMGEIAEAERKAAAAKKAQEDALREAAEAAKRRQQEEAAKKKPGPDDADLFDDDPHARLMFAVYGERTDRVGLARPDEFQQRSGHEFDEVTVADIAPGEMVGAGFGRELAIEF